jgi:septum formation protein
MINQSFIDPYKLILGSGSPRRSEILEMADIPFIKKVISIEEIYPDTIPVSEVPIFLAKQKAEAYTPSLSEKDIVLTADSVVIIDDQILGKPKDIKDAKKMIATLSNRTHQVITGVCLSHSIFRTSFASLTTVEFSSISQKEIDYYVDTYMPLDKAGGYGIQDWIGHNKVKSIQGSYLNVKGLPMEKVYHQLIEFIGKLKKYNSPF